MERLQPRDGRRGRRPSHRLLQNPAAIDDPLLNLAHGDLDFKIARMQPSDLVHPRKNGLERGQIGDVVNLQIDEFQLVQRTEAIRAHDAIVH